ncbi:AraC family transcriptional regulator [Paenibacillus sp. V4I5]|uniref:AraC family transcriptional regulator n=1 Tax=Paenibacillus sp. V4I5 TaxID=3042306 RepID=UPI0027937CEB|nr:AraC family transcriptional regulator [Paenibacillus sp. V4I5]MDQ0916103.1 AraC-like DNA-binding protein/quercetin dioxygenase-like cupin family protein [Paenibacillus sp. V4I5]
MDFADLHPYVYFATRYPFSKGQTSKNRICYASSLYLISEGRGVIHTNGRTYETVAGSLVYIPAGQPHHWVADSQDPMVHICCYFDWYYIDRRAEFTHPSMICYDAATLVSTLIGPAFPYSLPEHVKVEKLRLWIDLFEKFYTNNYYTNERTYVRSLKIQSSFQQFIEFFLTFALKEEHIPNLRMSKLLERLDQDLVQGNLQPLEIYYRELRISRGYFFDLFKDATGLTPTQYVIQFRINRVKDDLLFTNLNITEIADKHGFSSLHYFSKLFRKINGLSPREFREMNRDGL